MRARLLAALVACFALASAVMAQNRTSGGLSGSVRAENGTLVPGASVEITSPALIGGPRKATTDDDGWFRFHDLAPGRYRIAVSRSGFTAGAVDNVAVSVGLMSEVPVTLRVFGGSEEIVVRADRPPIDAGSSSMESVLSSSFLRHIPADRDPTHILDLAPGVNLESAYGGSEESGNGYQLDGIETSDPQGGAPWALFNPSIVQEIAVIGLGAPAEYGQFTGAVIEGITKSGGNASSGEAELYYAGQALAGNSQLEDLSASIDSDLEQTVQAGGAIRRDRLWYFVSGQYHHINSTEGGPTQHETTPRAYFKLTGAVSPQHVLQGWVQLDHTRVTGTNADEFTPLEATQNEDNPNVTANASWNGILSEKTLLSVAVGGYSGRNHFDPASGFSTPGHYDAQTGYYSVNAREFAALDRKRFQMNASVTTHFDDFGDHEFKSGAEAEHANVRDRFGTTGGVFYSDSEGPVIDPSTGKPDLYTLAEYGGGYRAHGTNQRVSVYVQDAWRITPRVTLNPGVRLDMNRGKVSSGTVFRTNPVAPRLGVTWDVKGDARTVLRAHYGRYYEALYSAFYYYTDPGAFAPMTSTRTFNTSGYTETLFTKPGQQYAIDPQLRQPYLDQFIAGFDRQLPRDIVLSGSLMYRRNRDLIETVSRDGIFTPVTGTNPLTGETVTLYDYLNPTTDVLIYTNPAGLHRTYSALMLSATRRLVGKWQMAASYVFSKTAGNIDNLGSDEIGIGGNTPFYQGGFLDTPNSTVNWEGRLTHDQRHQLKLYGTRLFPTRHLSLSAGYVYHSGDTWTPRADCLLTAQNTCHDFPQGPVVYFAEPRGSRRLKGRNELDLRIEWNHPLRSGREFRVSFDFFNINNQQRVTSVETLVGPNLGEPATANYQRWLRLGFVYAW